MLFKLVRRRHPAAGVVLVSAHFDESSREELAAMGIETISKEEVVKEGIVQLVARLSRDAGAMKAESFAVTINLTPRQRQVLEGIVAGETFEIIADRMNVSRRTVEKHAEEVYRKAGVHSRAELVAAVMGMSGAR